MASPNALENLPVEARGFLGGTLQQGYGCGYIIASLINLFLVPKVSVGWRALFWTASGISVFAACMRALLPESQVFLHARRLEKQKGGMSAAKKTRVFIREFKAMLRQHWLLAIYAFIIMTGTHDSLDLLYLINSVYIRLQFPLAWLPGPLPDIYAGL